MAFGEFRFGPVFMRLCYELGLADLAFTTLSDKVQMLRFIFNTWPLMPFMFTYFYVFYL